MRPIFSVETYVNGIRAGDRVLLGQAITLIESTRPDHQDVAQGVINELLSAQVPSNTLRIGVTGAPGVGKSTFIETLGTRLINLGHKVAVLAVDPTSAISKGSILGDKTRMEHLAASENAFIRPSPAGSTLGGVARKTRETIVLVESAGYDVVFVETVGVGQSETAVHGMTDLFLLLLLPGAGDELQGIKRGIVEMADLLVVNKADGDRIPLANQARAHYLNAVHLLPQKSNGWAPKVLPCSATTQIGLEEIWQAIEAFYHLTLQNGFFMENRRQQAKKWFEEALQQGLDHLFEQNAAVREHLPSLQKSVLDHTISPFAAAKRLLEIFQNNF